MIYNNSSKDFAVVLRERRIGIEAFGAINLPLVEEKYLVKKYSFLSFKRTAKKGEKSNTQVNQTKDSHIVSLDPNSDEIYDVSVLIPAWKTADYIEECLDSIYKQRPLEILVGVDGCQETLDKLLEIKHKYHNLKIFWSEENVGCYVIRNSLFRESIGNKIIFFDSDDIMMDELIPTVDYHLNKYDVVRFKFLQFWNHDKNDMTKSKFHGYGQFGITRKMFESAGGYLAWICGADAEFHKRIGAHSSCLKINSKPLFFRRKHDTALTVKENTKPNSEIRNNYKKLIQEKYHKIYIEPKRTNLKKYGHIISFNMATHPEGSVHLKRAIESILPICDKFRIYLNNFTEPPEFILNNPKIEYILGEKDLGSNGRLFWANSYKEEYYFTCDDDIEYSIEYIQKHIKKINQYNGNCLVTSHGKIINNDKSKEIFNRERIQKISIFYNNLKEDFWCNLGGVGVMCFDNSKIKIDISDFKYTQMCDLYIAKFAEENDIPIVVRAHDKKELKNLLTKQDRGGRIWDKRHELAPLHKEVEKNMVWSIRTCNNHFSKYISYQEYVKRGDFTNKGMAQIFYESDYKKRCEKPVKLDLIDFNIKHNINHPKFIAKGNMEKDFMKMKLPKQYCLKPIDGAGARGVFLMKNGINLKDNKKYTKSQIKKAYIEQSKKYVGYSLDFYVEELLLDENGNIPHDFKVHMIGQQMGCVLQIERFPERSALLYDDMWNIIGTTGGCLPPLMDADLQYNIEVFCKKIMSVLTIPTMRIDLYITHNKEIFLGELTGTAGAKKKLQGTEVGSYRTGINIPELDPMCFMDKYLGYLLIQQNDTRYFNFN